MKLAWLVLLAACGSRSPPTPTPTRARVPQLPPPPSTAHAASPTSCGTLEVSPPITECKPVLAPGRDALLGVMELSCQVSGLRNDGAVMLAHASGAYALGERGITPAYRQLVSSTLAGSSLFDLLVQSDGTRVLVTNERCESLPVTPESSIVGRSDGSVVYWGHDGSNRRFVVRSPDGTSRSVPLHANPDALEVWAQNGRVVSGYRIVSGEHEIGYYDEATGQLRPIRRGGNPIGLQLVPGAASDEPPTALYMDGEAAIVEQPDPVQGFRRIERKNESSPCPLDRVDDPTRKPSGKFRHRTNAVLLRMPSGGLWLAYTDSRGHCTYRLTDRRPLRREELALIARPPPPPPTWVPEEVYEKVELVLVPIERGRFGDAKHLPLPKRRLTYTGPWQYHPSVTAARARIVIGSVVIDLDPNKLASGPALPAPWLAPETTPQQAVTVTPTPPPANAPPFPALRTSIAKPLVMTALAAKPIGVARSPNSQARAHCDVVPRTASDPELVSRQLVLSCDQSRALAMASSGDRVAFSQFSQRGYEPLVEIAPDGTVTLTAQPTTAHEQKLRYVKGKLELGMRLPRNAPPTPPGWMIYEHDDQSVFATGYERGYELLRGTVDRTKPSPTWDWQPAFPGGRTPPKGLMTWPVFLPNEGRDPTIAYVDDVQAARLVVRTPDGKLVALPTWGTRTTSGYRVHEIAALPLARSQLPILAAKVDESIVVAYPVDDNYSMRALLGNERFPEMTSPASGSGCSEAVTTREREELYSPQLFRWGPSAGLAYLSTRVRERLRWTLVPSSKSNKPTCGWLVEETTTANELAIARLDATGAREVARVPVKYRPGTGAHGSNLLLDKQANVLHAIATSYGTTTYTRIALD